MEVIHNSVKGGLKTLTLDAICKNIIENNNENTDIAVLYQIFDQTLFKALDVIDRDFIELITITNSDRKYFSVQGTNGFYTIYPHINFCECLSFRNSIMNKDKSVMCKHVLACHLALALKKYKTRNTSEIVYSHR